ncbi:MAG TPA: ribosomal-protein-alanine N-acetyltransferase [Thermoplasmata archaeon]|nr:ribosomal-protein-alanine N-acetyltransferase [Thermoplasmata archaeon]
MANEKTQAPNDSGSGDSAAILLPPSPPISWRSVRKNIILPRHPGPSRDINTYRSHPRDRTDVQSKLSIHIINRCTLDQTMFRIRRFRRGDLDQVMGIVAKTLGENYDPSVYLHLASHWPEAFIVSVRGKRVIGFALGAINEDGSARLLMLAVQPAYRRRGVGSQLLRTFIRQAAIKGARRVILEVRVTNKVAIQFYRHHGFQIKGILQHYYTSGEDAYTMERAVA